MRLQVWLRRVHRRSFTGSQKRLHLGLNVSWLACVLDGLLGLEDADCCCRPSAMRGNAQDGVFYESRERLYAGRRQSSIAIVVSIVMVPSRGSLLSR